MWKIVVIPALIGISTTHIWGCLFLSFGLRSSNKSSGVVFVLGRLLGTVLLGVIIWCVGYNFPLPPRLLTLVFGISCMIFAILIFWSVTIKNKNKTPKCKLHKHKNNISPVFWLANGVFRGATPCLKFLLIVPLILAETFFISLIIVIVFALVSTIYPLISILASDVLHKYIKKDKEFKIVGAIIIFGVGLYYIIQYILAPLSPCSDE